MAGAALAEDAVDEVLYLARANEVSELSAYLSELALQSKLAKSAIVAAAVDPYSKNSALHYAAANGHVDVIKLLLFCDTDKPTESASGLINAVNDAGNTALHWAALNGHLECAKLLVQLGADVTIINKAGHDAVFEAEINDKGDVVEWLLGAVEALERGIGSAGETPTEADEQDGEVDQNTSKGAGEGTSLAVDNLSRQMATLETRDGTSQGG